MVSINNYTIARGPDDPPLHSPDADLSRNNKWKIKDELRALISFKKADLLNTSSLMMLGQHDIIFCRNVAIYFSKENRTKLFDCLARMLLPGGVLIIGATESLNNVCDAFVRSEFRGITYYIKR